MDVGASPTAHEQPVLEQVVEAPFSLSAAHRFVYLVHAQGVSGSQGHCQDVLAKQGFFGGVHGVNVSFHVGTRLSGLPFPSSNRSRSCSFSRFPMPLRIKDLCTDTRQRERGNERNAAFCAVAVLFCVPSFLCT